MYHQPILPAFYYCNKHLFFFTIFQTIVLALILAGFVYFCYKKGLHRYFLGLLLLLFAVFPLYPFYGISLWKDTPVSVVLFVFAVYLFHVFSHNPGYYIGFRPKCQ